MKIIQSLRFRIIVACILFAIVVNFGFTSIVFFILDTNDDDLFNWHIANETEKLVLLYQNSETQSSIVGKSDLVLIGDDRKALQEIAKRVSGDRLTKRILSFTSLDELDREGPVTITSQGYEIYEIRTPRSRFHVVKAVDSIPVEKFNVAGESVSQSLYYILDISEYDRDDQANFDASFLIFISISVILVLAILVGIHLTRSVVSPLTKLTDNVDAIGVEDDQLKGAGYYPDEVGFLATRINSFLSRIQKFVEREKSFSRDASHELRTPVASSQLAVDLARTLLDKDQHQNEKTGDKVNELLERIDRSNKDMSHLIETFLLLGREKKTDHQYEEVSLRDLCEESIEKNLYLRKKDEITYNNLVSTEAMLSCPKRNLSIVLDNLVRNAFQYTETGTVTVSGDEKAIKVTDTGLGISHSKNDKNEKLDGTGIGLTIVDRICKIHGWQFEIDSKADRGTIASIIF